MRPNTSSNGRVLTALAIIGLLVHGIQAGKLGMYWDDAIAALHALQIVDGDSIKFILDGSGYALRSERPLSYLPFMVSHVGFALSLSLAHWISVALLVLTASLLAMMARRIVDESWFSFAVGVVFLTYPLSPLEAIWPSTNHYIWASLLALLAMMLFLRGLKANEKRGPRWFVLAALLYLASMLTNEVFILIPPTFVSLYLLSKSGERSSNWKSLGPIRIFRPAAHCLGLFLMAIMGYAVWREMVLPAYGFSGYSSAMIVLRPEALAGRFLVGVKTAFVPLDDVLRQITVEFPPARAYVLLSGILSLAVWAIILRLLSSETRQAQSQESPWLHAVTCGVALAISGIVFLALSSASIGGVVGAGWNSRLNFVMTFGIAVAVPAFLGLLVSPYNRFTPLAGLLSVFFLIYLGFTSSILDLDKLLRPSTFFVVLRDFSLTHRLMIFGYVIGTTLFILVVILSSLMRARRLKHLPVSDRLDALWSRLSAHFLAATVACLVLFGSLFHFSVKGEYIAKWDQHKAMLEQLQRVAPALKDDTFVIMIRDRNDPVSPTHYEFSHYLMALYGNKSITGNMDWQLRFHRDGVQSTYYGKSVDWDNSTGGAPKPGVTPLFPFDRIPYDRLLIFQFDGRNLRMLPKIEVKTEEGEPLVVLNNPNRILRVSPVKTAVWRYIAE
jgi:hypothetical protein